MIELNVHLLVAEGIERAFVCQNSEKPCVLDNVSMVYFKVPISRLGILHIRNIWVFLSKLIIYLLSQKFHLRGVFRRQSWLF